jgi:hypothetical protein
VGLVSLAFCGLYLRSTSAWWHEDDPLQFARAEAIANPADIFADPSVLRRWGTGASLVPMHVLSYWIDIRIAGASPGAARIHQLVATVLVAMLIFAVLARFGVDPGAAALSAIFWLLLPATVAVHEFMGSRHYLEGLGWSLIAIDQLRALCEEPRNGRVWRPARVLACAAAAMLSKEVYAAAVPAFVFLYALAHRRFVWSGLAVLLAAGYAAYRTAMLGDPSYPHPFVSVADYLRYLKTLPYTLGVGSRGLVLVVALAVLVLAVVWKSTAARRSVVLFLGVLSAGLAATYPTAPAVLLTYETPGTWYRAVFLFQTTIWIGAAYVLGRFGGRITRAAAAIVFLWAVVPGTARTRSHWLERLAESEAEGRFYLAHPERLVYSEEPAYWFLPGLDALYGVQAPHAVGRYDPDKSRLREVVPRYSTIWRRQGGGWVEDDVLYGSLRASVAATAQP